MNETLNNNEPAAFGNTLLAAGFTTIAEQKPNAVNSDGSRAWVLAAWSENNMQIKVFADKMGTESCTADYWKSLETCL
jgi:hypothetical protein